MKTSSSNEAVFLERRQTFLMKEPLAQIGWVASQKLRKNQNFSTWNMVTVIVVSFLILATASHGVNFLINELEWQALQTNSWWGKSINSTEINNHQFNQTGNTKIFPHYLQKPIASKPFFKGLVKYIKINFGVNSALAADFNTEWQADLVTLSAEEINIKPGAAITIEAKYINNGSKTWQNNSSRFISLNVAKPYYHTSMVKHDFWYSEYQPAKLLEAEVKPGDVGTFRFALQAPLTAGVYKEYFILSAENKAWFKESDIKIVLNVGDVSLTSSIVNDEKDLETKIITGEIERDVDYADTSTSPTVVTLIDQALRANEPLIRVGLYKTEEPVIITASESFAVTSPDGEKLKILNENEKVAITYDNYSKSFLVSASGFTQALPWVTVSPLSSSTVFTIINYENRPRWNTDWNDNRYRGALEVRYGDKSSEPWVINELPMEDYIRGIKETSEVSPMEYQKAIAIAARTYAFWQLQDGKKHAGNNFTVDAVWDQVYRGYNAEVQIPKFSEAVTITEGVVVTYENEIALTPYFAQSDGRTRSYKEVWYGSDKPWLISVPDPTNAGLKKWGHGVGMSARGALLMASRQSKSSDTILKHYYTGVEIEKIYQRGVVVDLNVILSINEDEPRI